MAAQTSWVGRPRIKGSTESMRMILLTFAVIGLQFCWAVQMTYGTPYLLSLGLPKSKLSIVWVAGPLSGLIVQPIIGMVSDKSRSKYGRRRPFMMGGTTGACICLLLLGWAREVVEMFTADDVLIRKYTIALAIFDFYVLDFMINTAQSACRALIVDTLPVSKQQIGSAWASRMTGVGQMVIYLIGAFDLKAIFGNLMGETQLKKICFISAVVMALAQGTTCWAVQERVLVSDAKHANVGQKMSSILSQIYTTTRHMPDRIQSICWVQFWSWIGWFPFLFYGSTWVGEIYLRFGAPPASGESNDALTDVSRHGSMSFIVFSLVSFSASIVLPWLVQSPDDEDKLDYTARAPPALASILENMKRHKPTLLTTWALANLMFASSMVFAPLIQSVSLATVAIAFCGIPWAVAQWAPGAFLGVEINKMSSSIPVSHSRNVSYHRLSDDSIEMSDPSVSRTLHLRHSSTSSATTSSTGELSGIYLGILNIYTTLPQFVGTGISWIIFSIFEPGKSPELATDADPDEHHSTEGFSGIGVCLFIGAISAVGAAWATRKMRTNTFG